MLPKGHIKISGTLQLSGQIFRITGLLSSKEMKKHTNSTAQLMAAPLSAIVHVVLRATLQTQVVDLFAPRSFKLHPFPFRPNHWSLTQEQVLLKVSMCHVHLILQYFKMQLYLLIPIYFQLSLLSRSMIMMVMPMNTKTNSVLQPQT
jgi:hypothetical protein